MRKTNKKGSFADIFYLAVFTFLLAIVLSVGWLITSSLNDEWKTQTNLGTQSIDIMQNYNDNYVATFDNLFLAVFIGLYIGALVLAYNIDTSPIYFFLALFLMGVIVLVTGSFANAFDTFSENAALTTYVDDFTIIPFVMGRMVEIFVVMMFGLAGVMYARRS